MPRPYYVYQADTLCVSCARNVQEQLYTRWRTDGTYDSMCHRTHDETLYNSDEYPKGPYEDEDAGAPMHCGICHQCIM